MKIFLSHSGAQAEVASELAVALEMEDHSVFIDTERLGAGEGYHATIRAEIASSDLFIFLVSPQSVTPGRYALSELKLARHRWPNPQGQVLPVMVAPTPLDSVPAYLRAVTILSPEGNVVAEVAAAVADLATGQTVEADPIPRDSAEAARARPPEYRPVELVFRRRAERTYPVELRDSPLGSLEAQSCSLDPSALEAALAAGEGNTGAVLRTTDDGVAAEGLNRDELRRVGASLYAALFDSGLHPFLEGSLRSVDPQQGKGLRFLINTTDTPELARLPWEFLYSRSQDDFLFSRVLTPVVRWLDVQDPTPSLRVALPLRVLIAVATPEDRPELRVGEEIAHLDRELAELTSLGLVDAVRLEHATLESLDRMLVELAPHILHFVGHGGFEGDDGVVILEDEDVPGRSAPVRGGSLAVLLRNHLESLRLVFLNSCMGAAASRHDPFGGVAQSLIRRGMPAVVAMQFPVADRAAVILARHFYRYLASGYPVDAALTSTRAFLFAKGYEVEWGAPALYMRTPDGKLFDIPAGAGQVGGVAATAASTSAAALSAGSVRGPAPEPGPPAHDAGESAEPGPPAVAPPTTPPSSTLTPPLRAKTPGFELRVSQPVAIVGLVVILVAVLGGFWMLRQGGEGPSPGSVVVPKPPDRVDSSRGEFDRALAKARDAIDLADTLISGIVVLDLDGELRARLGESIEKRDAARTLLDEQRPLDIEDVLRAEALADQASTELAGIQRDAESRPVPVALPENDRLLAAANERVRVASAQEALARSVVERTLSPLHEDGELARAVGGDSGLASRLAAAVAMLEAARNILSGEPADAAAIARAEALANQASNEFARIREDAGRLDRRVAMERERRLAEEQRRVEERALTLAAVAAQNEIARAEAQFAVLNEELSMLEPTVIPPALLEQRDAASRDLDAARAQLASGEQARDIDVVRSAEAKASEVLADLEQLVPVIANLAATVEAPVVETVEVSSGARHRWTLRGQIGYGTGTGSDRGGVKAGGGPAIRLAFEKRFGRRIGLEAGLGYSDLKLDSGSGSEDLRFWQLTVGPTFHLTPRDRVDLFLTPVAAFVGYDDVEIETTPLSSSLAIGNDVSWGLQFGVDVPLSRRWGFNGGVRYLDTTARAEDGDLELEVKPLSLMLGFSLRF